ncbi:MAG: MBL fold metallo-hydrolase [Gammaproteobacteria bacterium]|nr:MBL fold metallo-hydrolase [Gammaproteobacteria bacterium]
MKRFVFLLAALAWPFSPALAQSPYENLTVEQIMARSMTELAPGLYSFGSFGERSLVVITDDGVIVTDPANAEHAAAMRAAVAAITDAPVRYMIYSHQHWDHVLGGQIFKEEGATVISHANCVAHFERRPHPELVMPDATVQGGEVIELGGRALRLMYFGRNHGDCLLVMQLEGTDVLFVNDLVTPYSVGLGFLPDYDPGEYRRTLLELEALPGWARMTGNHGIPVAPKAALNQRRRYIEALMTAVKDVLDSREYQGEALYDAIELPEEFRNMRGYDRHIRRAAERIAYYYGMGW